MDNDSQRNEGVIGKATAQKQGQADARRAQGQQKKKSVNLQDIPAAVLDLHGRMANQKQENNKMKSQLGSLLSLVKNLQKTVADLQARVDALDGGVKKPEEKDAESAQAEGEGQ